MLRRSLQYSHRPCIYVETYAEQQRIRMIWSLFSFYLASYHTQSTDKFNSRIIYHSLFYSKEYNSISCSRKYRNKDGRNNNNHNKNQVMKTILRMFTNIESNLC